ncbi:hypothetical protein B0J14DRAFT_108223 [Halenospora varia]|nr:hypothetical protein B0J14DRAFT_108223 [Halenospora varia]
MAALAPPERKAASHAKKRISDQFEDDPLSSIEDDSTDEQQEEEYPETSSPDDEGISSPDEEQEGNEAHPEDEITIREPTRAAASRTLNYGGDSGEETEQERVLPHPPPAANGRAPFIWSSDISVSGDSPGGQENGAVAGHDMSGMRPLLGVFIEREPIHGVASSPARDEDSSEDDYVSAREELTPEAGSSPVSTLSSLGRTPSLEPAPSSGDEMDTADNSMDANSRSERTQSEERLEVEIPPDTPESSHRSESPSVREEDSTDDEYRPPSERVESSPGSTLSFVSHTSFLEQGASSRVEVELADTSMGSDSGIEIVQSKHTRRASKRIQSTLSVKQSKAAKRRVTFQITPSLEESYSESEEDGRPPTELVSDHSIERTSDYTPENQITDEGFDEMDVEYQSSEAAATPREVADAAAEVKRNLRREFRARKSGSGDGRQISVVPQSSNTSSSDIGEKETPDSSRDISEEKPVDDQRSRISLDSFSTLDEIIVATAEPQSASLDIGDGNSRLQTSRRTSKKKVNGSASKRQQRKRGQTSSGASEPRIKKESPPSLGDSSAKTPLPVPGTKIKLTWASSDQYTQRLANPRPTYVNAMTQTHEVKNMWWSEPSHKIARRVKPLREKLLELSKQTKLAVAQAQTAQPFMLDSHQGASEAYEEQTPSLPVHSKSHGSTFLGSQTVSGTKINGHAKLLGESDKGLSTPSKTTGKRKMTPKEYCARKKQHPKSKRPASNSHGNPQALSKSALNGPASSLVTTNQGSPKVEAKDVPFNELSDHGVRADSNPRGTTSTVVGFAPRKSTDGWQMHNKGADTMNKEPSRSVPPDTTLQDLSSHEIDVSSNTYGTLRTVAGSNLGNGSGSGQACQMTAGNLNKESSEVIPSDVPLDNLSNHETEIGMRGGGNVRSKLNGAKSEKRSRTKKDKAKKYQKLSDSDEKLAQKQSSVPECRPDSAQRIYFFQAKDSLPVHERPIRQVEVDPEVFKDVKLPEQLRDID